MDLSNVVFIENKSKRNRKKNMSGGKGNGSGHEKKWNVVPPKWGEPHRKERNGKVYFYCHLCKFWALHQPGKGKNCRQQNHSTNPMQAFGSQSSTSGSQCSASAWFEKKQAEGAASRPLFGTSLPASSSIFAKPNNWTSDSPFGVVAAQKPSPFSSFSKAADTPAWESKLNHRFGGSFSASETKEAVKSPFAFPTQAFKTSVSAKAFGTGSSDGNQSSPFAFGRAFGASEAKSSNAAFGVSAKTISLAPPTFNVKPATGASTMFAFASASAVSGANEVSWYAGKRPEEQKASAFGGSLGSTGYQQPTSSFSFSKTGQTPAPFVWVPATKAPSPQPPAPSFSFPKTEQTPAPTPTPSVWQSGTTASCPQPPTPSFSFPKTEQTPAPFVWQSGNTARSPQPPTTSFSWQSADRAQASQPPGVSNACVSNAYVPSPAVQHMANPEAQAQAPTQPQPFPQMDQSRVVTPIPNAHVIPKIDPYSLSGSLQMQMTLLEAKRKKMEQYLVR